MMAVNDLISWCTKSSKVIWRIFGVVGTQRLRAKSTPNHLVFGLAKEDFFRWPADRLPQSRWRPDDPRTAWRSKGETEQEGSGSRPQRYLAIDSKEF
jgi:hypothetical protein